MSETTRNEKPDFQGLPNITLRQMEVFRIVCLEGSYANAALELRCTRANIKRVCEDFERAVGRRLFEEGPNRTLQPNPFANGLLGQVSPLSRSLRRLEDTVKSLHEKGRILRFAAAGEFFKGGLFTDFLARLNISDDFRPCFLRIDTKRFRTALLSAECDIYFGIGIIASDRLDLVNLQPIPWKFQTAGGANVSAPASPTALPAGKWWIAAAGEDDANTQILDAIHAAGAAGGRVLTEAGDVRPADGDLVLSHDTAAQQPPTSDWPTFQFSAALKKHHPYSELMPRLTGAAIS